MWLRASATAEPTTAVSVAKQRSGEVSVPIQTSRRTTNDADGRGRELIRDSGTIRGYDVVRAGRSSVSDDPETPEPDDPTAVGRSVAGERTGSGHDGYETTDADWGDEGEGEGGGTDADDGLFEEDFASAFAGGGGGDPSGFDGECRGDSAEETFESDIPRVDIGIEGLDEMIRGGVPERSLIAVIGSAGTGKTTVGLQFLYRALRDDEKAIFIALEESREAVLDTAEEKGWNFERYCADDRLAIVDLDPVEMATSLTGIRSELPRLIDEFGASRVVLDSVSLLETMYDDPPSAERRYSRSRGA